MLQNQKLVNCPPSLRFPIIIDCLFDAVDFLKLAIVLHLILDGRLKRSVKVVCLHFYSIQVDSLFMQVGKHQQSLSSPILSISDDVGKAMCRD